MVNANHGFCWLRAKNPTIPNYQPSTKDFTYLITALCSIPHLLEGILLSEEPSSVSLKLFSSFCPKILSPLYRGQNPDVCQDPKC